MPDACRSRCWVTVLAVAILGAGCGGDDEAPQTVTAPPETVTVTETETVPAGPRNEPIDCGDVGFEPQTDAGAFGIAAVGVSCGVARNVAAAAEDSGGQDYAAEGFRCSGVRRENGLARVEWTCARGDAEITFTSS